MTKSKHTPGPWNVSASQVSGRGYSRHIDTPHGRIISIGSHDIRSGGTHASYTQAFDDLPFSMEVAEANARLIAAAPDLLKALTAASDWIDAQLGEPRTLIQGMVQQAVAKATGEAA